MTSRPTISLNKPLKSASDVELFGRTLPRATQPPINCIVCQRYAPASQRPGVCVECQRDTAATLAHVYHCAESARERLHATADRWEAIYARSPVQERFDAYRASQDAAKRAKAEAWARKGIADLLAPLILAWLDYQQADTKKREIEQWVKRCEAVL
jgi:hypothetical protein